MTFTKPDHQNPEPLYVQVANIIERKILDREIPVGQKLPPEEFLCRSFSVSLDTMREALSKVTREGYISRRPSIGTIVINAEPKNELALKTKNIIGIVVCPHLESGSALGSHEDRRFKLVLEGTEEKAKENGLFVMYSTMNEAQFTLKGKEKDLAGIAVSGGIKREYFNVIKKSGVPFVLLGDIAGGKITDEKVDVIAQDDYQGSYMATKYLADLGHKRIAYAYLSAGDNYWEFEKIRGYTQALKDSGIKPEKDLYLKMSLSGFENISVAMKCFLDKGIPFTGLVCPEDFSIGVSYAVKDRKLKVPRDVSLISVGTEAVLTSVSYDARDIGRLGVERLIDRVTNPDWKPMRVITPNRLVVKESTRKM